MPPRLSRHHVLLLTVVLGGALAAAVYIRRDREATAEEQLLPSVRFHEALRARASEVAAEWEEDDEVAQRWAQALLAFGGSSESEDAVLMHFGAPPSSAANERASLLFAMVASSAKESLALPSEVLLYESERLVVDDVDEDLRPLAAAVRVYVLAEADACDRLSEPAGRMQDPLLDGVRALLVDGADACCAVRQGDRERVADRIRRTADDAERLGVAVDRVPLLRAWAHFSAGEGDEARRELESIEVDHLGDSDLNRYRMIRDAVARGDDTVLSTVDPRWLSSIIVEGIVEAVGRDADLNARLEGDATAQAALQFVRVEARLMKHARDLHPLFDHRP